MFAGGLCAIVLPRDAAVTVASGSLLPAPREFAPLRWQRAFDVGQQQREPIGRLVSRSPLSLRNEEQHTDLVARCVSYRVISSVHVDADECPNGRRGAARVGDRTDLLGS
jgi:hypothetical protein